MAVYKCTYFFGGSKWGWTETFYYEGLSGTTINDVVAAAKQLGSKRKQLLGNSYNLEAVRITQITGGGKNTSVFGVSIPGVQPSLQGLEPWAAFEVRLVNTLNAIKRSFLIRGIPSSWYAFNPANPLNPVINPAMMTALNNWSAELENTVAGNPSPWSIWAKDRTPGTNLKFSVVGVTIAGDPFAGYYKIATLGPTPPWEIGQRIAVTGAKGPGTKGLNGKANVMDTPAAGVYTISRRPLCPGELIQLTKPTFVYAPSNIAYSINDVIYERWVNRKTGRAFFGTRGRRANPNC